MLEREIERAGSMLTGCESCDGPLMRGYSVSRCMYLYIVLAREWHSAFWKVVFSLKYIYGRVESVDARAVVSF